MRIDSSTQSKELYVIRKQQEQIQETAKTAEQAQVQPLKADEYDKANPVGEEAEGVYSLSHDESGNLTVNYKPTAKSEAKAESQKANPTEQKGQPAQSGGAAPVTSSSDDDDDELEELKEQRDALRQQINRAADEETKQALRVQLQSIELQIAMKSAE